MSRSHRNDANLTNFQSDPAFGFLEPLLKADIDQSRFSSARPARL
jgi:hypothetical protein